MSKRTKKNALLWNTDINSEEGDFHSDASFERQSKRCNWCMEYRRLVAGEKCCKKCFDDAFRVCKRCKRPFPSEEHFQIDSQRCTSCAKKLAQERLRRLELKKKKVENLGTAENLGTGKAHRPIETFFRQRSTSGVTSRAREPARRKESSRKYPRPPKKVHDALLKKDKKPLYMRLFRFDESLPRTEEDAFVAFPVYTAAHLSANDGTEATKSVLPEGKKDNSSAPENASRPQDSDGEASCKANSLASGQSCLEDQEETLSNSWNDPSEDQRV